LTPNEWSISINCAQKISSPRGLYIMCHQDGSASTARPEPDERNPVGTRDLKGKQQQLFTDVLNCSIYWPVGKGHPLLPCQLDSLNLLPYRTVENGPQEIIGLSRTIANPGVFCPRVTLQAKVIDNFSGINGRQTSEQCKITSWIKS